MGLDKDGYYSLREILGYGAIYNIVLSDRGRGKSFGTKHFLMEKEHDTFMCLYRQSGDMVNAVNDWLDDLTVKDPKHRYNYEDFRWEGDKEIGFELYYRDELKGYFRYLTAVNRIKQETFPDSLCWMWLDEFIPMKTNRLQNLPNEGEAIRVIYKTIDHDSAHPREERGIKPLRVLMYANPWTWNSPILSYFHINGLLGAGIHRAGPGVVWELLEPLKRKEGGKMTVDDFLGDEVNKNMGFMDQRAFVSPLPKNSVPIYSVRINDRYYHLYRSPQRKTWIVGANQHRMIKNRNDKKRYNVYGTVEGLTEEETSLDGSFLAKALIRDAYQGKVCYDTINTKFDFIRDVSEL